MIEFDVREIVPHSGTMSLLDQVLECDEEALSAIVEIRQDSLFVTEGGVPAAIGIEYMAQAVAAWAGVQDRRAGRDVSIGFLVGTRRYRSSHPFFAVGSRLRISVRRELQGDNGLSVFDCRIENDQLEVSANLNVFQPDDVDAFLEQESAKARL
ncbi:hypothetical protein HBA55_31850 [Pseudomaricurvus alkylphenolicus]|uniref:ApeP family dehydratase n=1 Tax=Pseudomaricurvus alkylphenolicus TaxID=1306991 RepID=UPI001420F807|nr:hypothetical protein [Pseudomaricurvus alkylphenolicus]NIB44237.1 hypothetical protein [Pseudomaricurvus alkylphenolicus]